MSVIVFNTQRYFPQTELFHQRLLRYAKTMPVPENCDVIFEWVTICIRDNRYVEIPGKEFKVEIKSGKISEVILNESALAEQKNRNYAVHASARPGSYAPAPK